MDGTDPEESPSWEKAANIFDHLMFWIFFFALVLLHLVLFIYGFNHEPINLHVDEDEKFVMMFDFENIYN